MLHVVIILSSFADPHVILKLCNGLSSVEQFFLSIQWRLVRTKPFWSPTFFKKIKIKKSSFVFHRRKKVWVNYFV